MPLVDALADGVALLPRVEGVVPPNETRIALALTTLGVVCGVSAHACGCLVTRRDVADIAAVPTPARESSDAVRRCLRALEAVVVPPVLLGAWAVAFTAVVLVIAPPFDAVATSLVTFAIAVAVRVATYYRKKLSEVLATMLPAALLGVVIPDGDAVRAIGSATGVARRLLAHWSVVAYGVAALLLLELALRTVRTVVRRYDHGLDM